MAARVWEDVSRVLFWIRRLRWRKWMPIVVNLLMIAALLAPPSAALRAGVLMEAAKAAGTLGVESRYALDASTEAASGVSTTGWGSSCRARLWGRL